MASAPTSLHLVWHRADLRVHDNPALLQACAVAAASGGRVLPVVVIDERIFARPDLTLRRKAWFLANVAALRERYRQLGTDLVVRQGEPVAELRQLLEEVRRAGATLATAHFVSNFTPYAARRDAAATQMLQEQGVVVTSCPGQYVFAPGEVTTQSGGRYEVFTPYRRKWALLPLPHPQPPPGALQPYPAQIRAGEIAATVSDIPLPPAGETAALHRLESFLEHDEPGYEHARNEMGLEAGTSRLAWYFNLGTLSARFAAAQARSEKWSAELTWRDFHADLLARCPHLPQQEFNPAWREFPWRQEKSEVERWQEGLTGYPLVDAGMRELAATGFMHNRVRMVCASLFTKHLLLDWRLGEAIFRGLLLCGDTAQNVGNWQWVAGCGVDAAPWFRIFNPVTQSQKFDLEGTYLRRWLPELRDLPSKAVHTPWLTPLLAPEYPAPMIELAVGRDRFLATAAAALGKTSAAGLAT